MIRVATADALGRGEPQVSIGRVGDGADVGGGPVPIALRGVRAFPTFTIADEKAVRCGDGDFSLMLCDSAYRFLCADVGREAGIPRLGFEWCIDVRS